jgi:regulatory protein
MKGRPTKDKDRFGELLSIADPAVITGMSAHPRRPGRIVIELDGSTMGALPVDLIREHALATGLEVGGDALANLLQALRRTAVLDKALDLLAVRSRASGELATRLKQRGAVAADVGWVIERLTAQGYLDDAAWARQLAESRAVARGASRRAIRNELQRKGISPEVARTAIEDVDEQVGLDEQGTATAIAHRRLRSLQSVDVPTRRRRLYAFLARRGYEPDVINTAIRNVMEGGDD